MAQMIPDAIPSKASQGEKTLYGILRDGLPDDFLVWYEPEVDAFYPDFVILGPDFGLLILEAKGWYPNQIVKANKTFFQIKRVKDGVERCETERSPLRQANDYYVTIKEKLLGYPILRQLEGKYEGNLVFPIGVGAVMSNITEAQARDDNLYCVLEKPTVTYRDELLTWKTFSDRELIQRLKRMFKVDFGFYALTDDQISTIKGIIHPEMKIREVPATAASVPAEVELPPDSTIIINLDIEQEKLARKLKGGHYLFSGVAGSGKTLILLARFTLLLRAQRADRILPKFHYLFSLPSHFVVLKRCDVELEQPILEQNLGHF